MFSPETGCFGPNGWHDSGASHDGRLEVDVGGEMSFIFTESSPFDSYDHVGHGPYVNLRDAKAGVLPKKGEHHVGYQSHHQ